MLENTVFTSESVSEGHPDKMADQISDAVLDAILEQDPKARVACETLIKTGIVVLAGEVTTTAWVDLEALVRKTVLDIGYDSSRLGFDGATCAVVNCIGKQSPDIAQGVDRNAPEEQGAGDQGLMFGYATNETDVLMPAPVTYSHRLVQRQSEARRSGTLPWLRPDAKSQVSMRYENGQVVAIDAVVLSTQHDEEVDQATLREEVLRQATAALETLRSHLRGLEVIASLSPLLGLLGTVLGMIEAFRRLQEAGSQVDPAVLSGGIWEALLTTAVGLAVAIPAVAALNWLERRIERFGHRLEDSVTRVFTARLHSPAMSASPTLPATAYRPLAETRHAS